MPWPTAWSTPSGTRGGNKPPQPRHATGATSAAYGEAPPLSRVGAGLRACPRAAAGPRHFGGTIFALTAVNGRASVIPSSRGIRGPGYGYFPAAQNLPGGCERDDMTRAQGDCVSPPTLMGRVRANNAQILKGGYKLFGAPRKKIARPLTGIHQGSVIGPKKWQFGTKVRIAGLMIGRVPICRKVRFNVVNNSIECNGCAPVWIAI